MGGVPDKIGRVAMFPYGVTRTAIDAVGSIGGGSTPKSASLVTKAQYDKAIADWTAANPSGKVSLSSALGGDSSLKPDPDYASKLQAFKDTMSVLPPPTPDLADEAVQKARQAARRKILMGGMTGPLDLTSGGAKALPGLSGV